MEVHGLCLPQDFWRDLSYYYVYEILWPLQFSLRCNDYSFHFPFHFIPLYSGIVKKSLIKKSNFHLNIMFNVYKAKSNSKIFQKGNTNLNGVSLKILFAKCADDSQCAEHNERCMYCTEAAISPPSHGIHDTTMNSSMLANAPHVTCPSNSFK